MLAFLGGFSSATSMVIVATIALSTMVSNHVIIPLWLHWGDGASRHGDLRRVLLLSRRLSIIAILGPGLGSFYIAMALVGWVSYARLIRAQILVLKTQDFAVAAASLGFSRLRIMFRHLLPNALAGSLVFVMSDAMLVLLNGAAISYLGLGVQPPVAEWGVMVAEAQGFITQAWWITLFPGLAIVTLAFGFSLTGDALADLMGVHE